MRSVPAATAVRRGPVAAPAATADPVSSSSSNITDRRAWRSTQIIDTTTSNIVNVVEYPTAPANPPPGFGPNIIAVLAPNGADTSWTWTGTTLVPPAPPPAPVPQAISRRQFFQQLAVQAIITQADAISAIKVGAIPSPLQTLINALPSDQQFAATMMITGAADFMRAHPLTISIGTAYGMTTTQIDQFFQAAAAL